MKEKIKNNKAIALLVVFIALVIVVFVYKHFVTDDVQNTPILENKNCKDILYRDESGDKKLVVDTKVFVEELIKSSKKTKIQSVQDCPVNVSKFTRLDVRDNEDKVTTIFIYKRRGKYYLERPYQGIWKLDSKAFQKLFVNNENFKAVKKVWDKAPMLCVDNSIYCYEKPNLKSLEDNYEYIGTVQSTVEGDKEPVENMQSNCFKVGSKVYKFEKYIMVEHSDGSYTRLIRITKK